MEHTEKEYKKLRLGLALRTFMDKKSEPRVENVDDSANQKKSRSLSFRKLESASGIRHATIVEIVNGKKNAAWSTVDALLDGLAINLSKFAAVYDSLTEQDVLNYKVELEKAKEQRKKKKKKK